MSAVANPNVAIQAQPISAGVCRFTVDRPVCPNRAFHCPSSERAEGSPLLERLFGIAGVSAVLVAHEQVTVTKSSLDDWPVIGKQVGAVIREHLASGLPAVADAVWQALPPAEEIRRRVEHVLQTQVNPAVASHGGYIGLIDVRENNVYLQMGGGCQGCGQANVTLKQGVEREIRAAVPEVGEIIDATDHAAGRNPYYAGR